MFRKTVLAIGLNPAFADFSAFPDLTPELIRYHIDTQIQRLHALGYDAESCLIDTGKTAESMIRTTLRAKHFDCIVIGAGLRVPPERLPLFETVINLIHTHAPDARICFNTTPADTAEAVGRWIAP